MGNRSKKLMHFLRVDPRAVAAAASAASSPSSFSDDDGYSSSSIQGSSASSSPSRSSSSSNSPPKSPWSHLPGLGGSEHDPTATATGLIASLVKEDGNGKVYSLAASGDVLYTGTDSDTVRVLRDGRHVGGFRSGSGGLVKAIVVSADGHVVFTGHQDGKVRVWLRSDDPASLHHRRVGSLPPLGDLLASSVNPASYVRSPRGGRRRGRGRAVVWLRHCDAVSALSLDEGAGVLYSASWDGTFKAWRVSDHRCLDSVHAHDDAVNTVAAAGFAGGLVLTGAADGTVKVWRRLEEQEGDGRTTARHELVSVLREGGDGVAVTAIAACPDARAVYVGSSDGLVTCWRWGPDGRGEPTRAAVLDAGHGNGTGVLCLAVSGRVVVSGAADGTLCVWRRDGDGGEQGQGHARLAVLKGHTGPVRCVAVAAEDDDDEDYCDAADGGERRFVVYSGSLDGSVKVWRLSEDQAMEKEPEPPAVEAAPLLMMALRESSEAWTTTTPRHQTAALQSPVQRGWAAPELKGVAAA